MTGATVNKYLMSDCHTTLVFNYINAYSDAIRYYKLFKEKYPEDELILSVEYELNSLMDIQSKIDSLNSIVKEKSNI